MKYRTLPSVLILFLIATTSVFVSRTRTAVAVLAPSFAVETLHLPIVYWNYFQSRLIEDFEADRRVNWWTPDPQAFKYGETSQRAKNGTRSFKIEYTKSGPYQFIGADPISSDPADFRGAESLQVWVYGQVSLLLKLEDSNYQQVEVGILNASDPQNWSLLQFDLSGLAQHIDLSQVKLLLFPEPGDSTANGIFFLDDLILMGDS